MTIRIRVTLLTLLLLALCICCAHAATTGTLQLPTGLTTIEAAAFYKDTSLNQVTIPDGATRIESKAFANSSVKTVTLPESLTYIADDAFDGCTGFKPKTTTGSYAWMWCVQHGYIDKPAASPAEDFEYEALNGLYAKITKYTGSDKVVVIPEEIDDYIIQVIGSDAFKGNKIIEYVWIPDTVTEIGAKSFNTSTVRAIDFGKGVTTIGDYAFYACNNLVQVDFPDSVTTMGREVLRKCSNLESVGYPTHWESANSNGAVFADCPKLLQIDVPVGTTTIPNYAFANCPNLKKITLPEGLVEICHHAFSNCIGLTEMIYPSTIKTVGGINGCTGIHEITIPDGAEKIGTNAFDSVPLTTISIPQSIQQICDDAFNNCSSLVSVLINSANDSLKTIGYRAFKNCVNLSKIALPDSVTSIGSNAFSNCKLLSDFHYPSHWNTVLENYGANDSFDGFIFEDCTALRSIIIPEGVKEIPAFAFRGSKYLRKITLPSSLLIIGYLSFADCEAITSIDFPNNLVTIRISAFQGCSNLKQALLPDSVTTIGSNAFSDCKELSDFHYPSHWNTVIENYGANDSFDGFIFEGCTSLQSITVPDDVIEIPAFAFRGSKYLRNVFLPSSLQTIGYLSFAGCEAITNIDFPTNLKTIGKAAFSGCANLQQAILPDSVTTIGSNAFTNCVMLVSFHYPKCWDTVLENYGVNDSFDGFIFQGCSSLKRIDIPYETTTIPSFAFRGSDYIETIYAPELVNSIGKYAFSDCPALTLWTEYSAYALQYARNNGVPYYYLSLNGETYPMGTLYKGDGFEICGYVRSNYNVTNLKATLYSVTAKKNVFAIDLNPATNVCNLYELVNPIFKFGELDLGEYTYTVEASTELETETFIASSFQIALPPLRSISSELFAPSGSLSLGMPFSVSGTLESNYAMQSAVIGIYNTSGSSVRSYNATPSATTLDISSANSALSIQSLSSGSYIFRITITGNGETISAFESRFTILTATKQKDRITTFDAAFNGDSFTENTVLRRASVELANAAYERAWSILELRDYGFALEEIESNYNWGLHICPYTLGWKDIENSNGTKTRLFAIVCTGTHNFTDWVSNFTVVDSGKFHDGFNRAAQYVLSGFTDYLNRKRGDNKVKDCKVLVTGHSRGAAVANILAGKFLPELGFSNGNIYAYTFACPNVYRGSLTDNGNVYNYNLGGDLVPRVPFDEWGYSRYGHTLTYTNNYVLHDIKVIDTDTMNRMAAELSGYSSDKELSFYQTVSKWTMENVNTNNILVAKFVISALIRECSEAYKVGSFRYNQLGNDTETVARYIVNTHQPSTYVTWINRM